MRLKKALFGLILLVIFAIIANESPSIRGFLIENVQMILAGLVIAFIVLAFLHLAALYAFPTYSEAFSKTVILDKKVAEMKTSSRDIQRRIKRIKKMLN